MQPLVPVPNGANIKGFVFLVDNSFGAEGIHRSGINSLPLEKYSSDVHRTKLQVKTSI
jgi:hypothetical protein